ncbi:DUF6507 family protein [Arthrobacter citreus]|uniref:DUF6507 family protein n=1 Tax=Arthrobacter citreus TaxID=1670 RepID=UPI0036DB7C16
MKFELPPPTAGSSGGADGVFDIDPAAVSAVVLETDAETAAFADLSYALFQDLSELVEECRSDAIAEQLVTLAEDTVHRGMNVIQRRTGNALNAVAEVLTILHSADASMRDTARAAAAAAAQAKADDDPYAFERPDRNSSQVTAW